MFPRPWQVHPTGPNEVVVLDADDRKLFYVMGDEGDGDEAKPSALFHGTAEEHIALMEEIHRCLTSKS
jgi:hypothetical protein